MAEKINIKDAIRSKTNTGEVNTQTYAEADRKRGGRPKKEGDHKLTRVPIYLSNEELEKVEQAAARYGLTVGKFVKMATMIQTKTSNKI
jgi:predicted DNA binding CopG/RHH family protein